MGSAQIDFPRDQPVAGNLEVRWIHGSRSARHNTDPKIQVHAYDEHTYILRQNKAVHYEGPFMYLFCGNDRALLLDTGATADSARFPLRDTVDGILSRWLAAHPRDSYELVVAHTHAHGDHVAADGQFEGGASTVDLSITVVPKDVESVRSYFGFSGWPDEIVRFDLGGRVLEITGCPGHHEASIAVYDRWTGFLVTGDTVYPGRLYVQDFPAFTASLDRLVAFAASRPVTYVMGCHIEMTSRPRRDYPLGATFQPDEPPLQMSPERLTAIRDAARSVADKPGVHVYDDFIIFHGPCRGAIPRYVARGLWSRLRNRFSRAG